MLPPRPDLPDPFDTAALREATLSGWVASPTRLAEDAAAEAELLQIGYRDRLFTELCANAADAAKAAGQIGRVAIRAVGTEIRVANTGAPLTADGVRSLTALRVSPKQADDGIVGRFGMGFRATSLAPRVVVASRSGSIEFDAERSRAAVAERLPTVSTVPAQRLAWPSDAVPADGYDTEVLVDVADADLAASLLSDAAEQVPDLLLELESIDRIEVGEHVYARSVEGDHAVVTLDGVEHRRWLQARSSTTRWLVPVRDDRVLPLERDVLRSPTATDIETTLPARLIAQLPLTPDRRDLHPTADVTAAAAGYPELVALVPDDQKQSVIPASALAAGRVDALLREAIRDRLASAQWVPSATGTSLAPTRTWVFPGLTSELAEILGELLEPLANPDVSDRVTASLLVGLGARQLGLADIADLLAGVDEPPTWWARLYGALAGAVADSRDAEELGTLPVPRADGRMHVGARGLFLIEGLDVLDDPPAPTWVPTLAPAAYDPLLERLGLSRMTAVEALADPGLLGELDAADDHDHLADIVLRLLSLPGADRAPTALGALELRGADGDDWPADELLLPDSPLATVLVDDSPFGTVHADVVASYGAEALRRLGVGWGFSVVHDPSPIGPDHDLPDEDTWWDGHEMPPDEVRAVRDLDLVDPNRWPAALELLAADETTAPLLAGGYTRWWLRRHAEVDGVPLRRYRPVDDLAFRGLFDAIEVPDDAVGLLAGTAPDDAQDAQAWLELLADRQREVAPGVAVRAHAALLAGLRAGRFTVADVAPPDRARTLTGATTDDPIVLDAPWWTPAVLAAQAVLPGLPANPADAALLADLLDATTAADRYDALPDPGCEPVDPDDPEAVAALAAAGIVAPRELRLHDDLHVTLTDDETSSRHRVPMWIADDETVHLNRGPLR